jgi:hypothetical protein
MTEEITADKSKFDRLLKKMLTTPPLPKADIRVAKPKPKKKKKPA